MSDQLSYRLRKIFIGNPYTHNVSEGVEWLKERIGLFEENGAPGEARTDAPVEGRILIVTGLTGAGKNTAIMHAVKPIGLFSSGAGPVLYVSMPETCTRAGLGVSVLNELGYEMRRTIVRAEDAWMLARHHLTLNRIRILWIDEFDDIVRAANRIEIIKMANLFRSLVERSPLCLILSGQPQLQSLFESHDRQELKRRSRLVHIDKMDQVKISSFARRTTDQYCAVAKIENRTGAVADFGNRLHHADRGAFGSMCETIIEAIEIAVRRGDGSLGIEHFAQLHHARTSCTKDNNPYVTQDWHNIDPTRVGGRGRFNEELANFEKKKRSR